MSITEQPVRSSDALRRADVLRASPPMFASRALDRLSRVHPAVVPVVYLPVIVGLGIAGLARMGVVETAALALAGFVFWTLTEYWLHRIVFHFEPEGRVGARLHWMIHGVHHDHPNDPMRLVMPPAVSVPLALLFYGLFVVTMGAPASLGFAAGFLAGYLNYDMTHYYVHHHRPRSGFGRKLRELHMRHHFQDDTVGFGVSAPWWDRVFGTAPRARRRRVTAR